LSPEAARPTGRPPGSKPIHLVYGVVLAVAWVVLMVWVVARGHGGESAVDVYSELPPAFTNELAAKGVLYQGLSPVDSGTVEQALAHASVEGATPATGSDPIVLRTSFSETEKGYTDQPALMIVLPVTSAGGGSAVFVAFLDPTTYKTLTSLSYPTSGGPG
jgi:hypothetical protein